MFVSLFEYEVRTWVVVADFFTANEAGICVRTADHSVVFYCIAVRASIEIDAEATVVGGIGGRERRTDIIAADDGTRLVAEGIDAAGVIELTGIVADIVTLDAVVLHTCVERCPSPTDADA